MIKILFLIISSVLAGHHPTVVEEDTLFGGTVRYFHKFSPKISALAAYSRFTQQQNDDYQSFKIGARYRLLSSWKLGLFFDRRYGLRHDEDWVSSNGTWLWRSTKSRDEDFLILDSTHRFHIPLDGMVAEIRGTYEFNEFNNNQTFKFRPGLNYIWFLNGKAFAKLFTRIELYFPLNYGQETIYEKWFYIGALFPIMKNIDFGPSYSYSIKTWTQTDGFAQHFANRSGHLGLNHYHIEFKEHTLALNLNFKGF